MSLAEPTKAETILRNALEKYKLPTLYDQVYCFLCGEYFTWMWRWLPEYCMNCGALYDKAGQFARPDVLLERKLGVKEIVMTFLGVVYVNGGVHNKHRTNMRDYNQIKSFLDKNIQVFIVLNEDILEGKKKAKTREAERIAKDIRRIFNDDSGESYEAYRKSKTFSERYRKY